MSELNEPPGRDADHVPVVAEPVMVPCNGIGSFTHEPEFAAIFTTTCESIIIVSIIVVKPHSLPSTRL